MFHSFNQPVHSSIEPYSEYIQQPTYPYPIVKNPEVIEAKKLNSII